MTVRRYILDNLFEFVLLLACSACLSMQIGDAFNISYETLFNVPLVLGAEAPLLLVCYAAAYRRRNLPWGIIACLVLMAVVVWVGSVTSVAGTFQRQSVGATAVFNDAEGNNLIFGFVLAIVAPLSFVLSRRRVFCTIYLVLGFFICALIQWLYVEWLWAPFVVFLVAAVALLVQRCYRAYAASAEAGASAASGVGANAGAMRLVSALSAVLVSGLLVAIAFAGWALVIEPLNPPAQELKLVRMYYQPDIEWVSQYATQDPNDIDEDETSSDVDKNNDQTTSDNKGKGNGGDDSDGETEREQGSTYTLQNLVEQYRSLSYQLDFDPTPLIIALTVLLVVGSILLRRYLRKRWHDKLAGHSDAYRVCAIYDRVTRDLARMKFVKPAASTQVEFATSSASAMAAFAQDTDGVDYLRLSQIYERVYFGHERPTEEDVGAFESFLKAFYKNARKFSGPFRWIWRFWRM